MKTELLVPIIGGVFLLVSTIVTIVFTNSSNKESSKVQFSSTTYDNSTHIDEVENLTINQ
ncbi:MAG: Unknown protein [uncultured Sulfurovum sp.]|uniref:Uncharacterized protein n=1 Tax=uncultured Sulfurovum sp. TaxID=269237 RepID=A0A6S6RRP3_9BACT|nr:MAG: Unknown protein [uncultured Sulfurovum sp.]